MMVLQYLRNLLFPPEQYDDPKDWSKAKKNMVVVVISYCAFTAPLGSNIYMPAVLDVRDDLKTTSAFVSATLSVYVLVMGIMPVFWAALCDYSGRRPIYLLSMMIFILGSLGAALSHNIGMFFAMRTIQAFGSSSVLSVGGGSLSDCFHSGERGTAFGLFYLGPLVGPMVGPTVGGLLSNAYGWRTTMWLLVACAILAFLMVLFLLPETYRKRIDRHSSTQSNTKNPAALSAPSSGETMQELKDYPSHIQSNHSTLIESRESLPANGIENEKEPGSLEATPITTTTITSPSTSTGKQKEVPKSSTSSGHGEGDDESERETSSLDYQPEATGETNKKTKKRFNPLRPLTCLRSPTNAILVGFNALALGAQFCMNNTLPISFDELYHFSESTIGLCMMAGGAGSALGSLLGGRYSDFVLRRWLIRREVERLRSEHAQRIASTAAAAAAGQGKEKLALPEIDEKAVAKTVSIKMGAPPEVRLRSVWLGVVTLPLGLLLFGWSIESKLPVAAPLVGIFLVGFGMMMVFSSATTALVDSNADNNMATSAVACNSFARGLTGAIGGFLALPLMDAMGSGWLYTFWALLTILGSFGLLLMILRAETWRQRALEKKKLEVV
ncbi:hypothetical protein BGW42_007919 [Actinomortierella wolfii]|nr:hypothetical protein BGW42_007919 [Actinomortierella wolfii]